MTCALKMWKGEDGETALERNDILIITFNYVVPLD
jgi:hypothetical protein